MTETATFEVTIGKHDFPTALANHLRQHPGHEITTIVTIPPKDDQPGQLVGMTRKSPPVGWQSERR